MNFSDATTAIKAGKKVTRTIWKETVYFLMKDNTVYSFQPVLRQYGYTEDIMVSDGWIVDASAKTYKFCDIIGLLLEGSTAKLESWKDTYIYLDRSEKILILRTMEGFPFIPQFNDFLATDWIIVNE